MLSTILMNYVSYCLTTKSKQYALALVYSRVWLLLSIAVFA